MGWIEWLLNRLARHLKRILRFYKPEIKKVAAGTFKDGLDDLKKEFYEKTNAPDFAKTPIESFTKYIKENSDAYIEKKVDELLNDDEQTVTGGSTQG